MILAAESSFPLASDWTGPIHLHGPIWRRLLSGAGAHRSTRRPRPRQERSSRPALLQLRTPGTVAISRRATRSRSLILHSKIHAPAANYRARWLPC